MDDDPSRVAQIAQCPARNCGRCTIFQPYQNVGKSPDRVPPHCAGNDGQTVSERLPRLLIKTRYKRGAFKACAYGGVYPEQARRTQQS